LAEVGTALRLQRLLEAQVQDVCPPRVGSTVAHSFLPASIFIQSGKTALTPRSENLRGFPFRTLPVVSRRLRLAAICCKYKREPMTSAPLIAVLAPFIGIA
jgi:hypothetical protein